MSFENISESSERAAKSNATKVLPTSGKAWSRRYGAAVLPQVSYWQIFPVTTCTFVLPQEKGCFVTFRKYTMYM